MYLTDGEDNDVLLPTKYIQQQFKVGDYINVFVYRDNEGRPIATTLEPFVQVNSFASLEVKQITKTGCFLEMGVEKDLLLPFSEKRFAEREGDFVVVYVYIDQKTGRLVATEKLNKHFTEHTDQLHTRDEVEVLVYEETPLGMKCVVNNAFSGILYHNEISTEVLAGDQLKAYVKRIRTDGKLDLQLQKIGFNHAKDITVIILDKLESNKGFLPLHDKSEPQKIQAEFGVSKKVFKQAIGHLYRIKKIRIDADGIRLLKS